MVEAFYFVVADMQEFVTMNRRKKIFNDYQRAWARVSYGNDLPSPARTDTMQQSEV